jgi:hypothetical protein
MEVPDVPIQRNHIPFSIARNRFQRRIDRNRQREMIATYGDILGSEDES